MPDSGRWAAIAAQLPTSARAERERPFWSSLAASQCWRRVVDAGCGAGFHVALLRDLGVEAVGFDVSLPALKTGAGGVAGDVARPPLRPRAFDAALCLGNTISLLSTRVEQASTLASLADLVRPGGWVLVQGEDVAAAVAGGPVVRTRALEGGASHVRIFERRGRRVRMLAGITHPGSEAPLETTLILPTTRRSLLRLARPLGLRPVEPPLQPPSGAATWWAVFSAPSPGS